VEHLAVPDGLGEARPPAVEQRRLELLQLLLGPALRGQPRRRHLEQVAGLGDLADRQAVGLGEQPQARLEVAGDLLRVRVRDERPAGHTAGGGDEVLAGEHPQRLAHRRAAHPVLRRQIGLDGQLLARFQLTSDDPCTKRI
jgi:hypothetical protein